MKPLYCTESQDRIPFEYFAQGKAIWSGGKPYMTRVAMELGLKPDAAPPASFTEGGAAEPEKKAGPPPIKVVNPMGTSSMEMAAIPGSSPALAELPKIPKQDGPSAPAAASTVMGPGVKNDDEPMVSPPPIYVKSKTGKVPLPPPPEEDKLDPTVPEVNINQRKVLPSPLEAPTIMAKADTSKGGVIKPPPPSDIDDNEKTPPMMKAEATPAPVAEKKPDAATQETPVENPAVAALLAQVEQGKAEQAKLDAEIAEAQERVNNAQTSLNELNRKILVDAEAVEGNLAAGKAREKEEGELRKRIEELQKIENEAKAAMEKAAKERTELEEKARGLSVARAKSDMETKQKKQAENRLKADLDTRKKVAAETEAILAATRKAKADSLAKIASAEAEIAKLKADEEKRKAEAEKAAKERAAAVEKARKEAEAKAKKEAEERAKKEAEEKAKREAEELNKAELELQEKLEAVKKARREAEERAKRGS